MTQLFNEGSKFEGQNNVKYLENNIKQNFSSTFH